MDARYDFPQELKDQELKTFRIIPDNKNDSKIFMNNVTGPLHRIG